MITALDTNVLFDLFRTDSAHHSRAVQWIREAYTQGEIVICEIVYAELAPAFDNRSVLDHVLRDIDADLSPLNATIAYEAGLRWKAYRRAGGSRTRIITDFLIGAHALHAADVFLTRDRGFFATYFPELQGFSPPVA